MNKTFVYICRAGENEELRYSLRSLDKFYPGANVWVVGGKPDWYIGNYLPVTQTADKFYNVRCSLNAIVNDDRIPNDIIVMNDDFFFVKRVRSFKTYVSGTLQQRITDNLKNSINSSYIRKLDALKRHCKQFRNPPLDFDIHVPMPAKKDKLAKIVSDAVMWRSNYGNRFVNPKSVVVIEDVKVYPEGRYSFKSYDYTSNRYPFFSTQDDVFDEVLDKLLRKKFPNPSRFESEVVFSGSQDNAFSSGTV